MAHGQRFWMKLGTQDWRSNEKLRLCSLAARGLWIEMLCFMNGGTDEVGYLKINDRSLGPEEMAKVCGVSIEETTEAWKELEIWNVIKKDDHGCVFSSRMVNDHRLSIEGRKAKLTALGKGEEVDPLEDPLEGALKGGLEGPSKASLTTNYITTNSYLLSCISSLYPKEERDLARERVWEISKKLHYLDYMIFAPSPHTNLQVPACLGNNKPWVEKFKEWAAYRRREKHNPLTWTSVRNQLKSMERVGPEASIEAIDIAMIGGWTGVFPEKVKPKPKPRGRGTDEERETRRKQFEDLENGT